MEQQKRNDSPQKEIKHVVPTASAASAGGASITSWQSRKRYRSKKIKLTSYCDNTCSSNNNRYQYSYEFNDSQYYNEICLVTKRQERPLPAVSTLLSSAPQQKSKCNDKSDNTSTSTRTQNNIEIHKSMPILEQFFNALQKSITKSKCKKHHGHNSDMIDTDIDKPVDIEIDLEGVQIDKDKTVKQNDRNNNVIDNIHYSVTDKASMVVTGAIRTNNHYEKNNNDENYTSQNPLKQTSNILTKGHHKRFKELLLELEKNGIPTFDKQRKKKALSKKNRARQLEFIKLCDLFREERNTYATAINDFKIKYSNRFLIGFRISSPASEFVNANAEYTKRWKQRWIHAQQIQNNSTISCSVISNTFGPCSQAISLLSSGECGGVRGEEKLFDSIMIGPNMFQPTIVHRDVDSLPILKIGWTESVKGNKLIPGVFTATESNILLCQDEMAKSLAKSHHADIVLTSEAIEAFIRNPLFPSGRWTIPLSFVNLYDVGIDDDKHLSSSSSQNNIIPFVEDPLPSVSTPRECLSVGIREALIGTCMNTSSQTRREIIKGKDTYTMLTIPTGTSTRKLKALVRSRNYIIDENQKPIILQSQLEYFLSQCGMEEYTHYDRASWFVTKMLQPDSNLVVIRVDANTTKVVTCEEKTVVDCLTANDTISSERYLDSLGPFEENDTVNIASLLHIICTIISASQLLEKRTDQQHLLCRESVNNVICRSSVKHKHDNAELFDILKEIDDKGTAVLLNESTLLSCFKDFQWATEMQCPYTFSFKDATEEI